LANQADAEEREIEVDETELELEAEAPEVEGEEEAADQSDEPDEGEEDELEITFGDETAPVSSGEESVTFQELRKRNRQLAAENAALKATVPAPQQIEVGEKPTLESCDYDEARFEQELDAWKERGRQAEDQKAQAGKRDQEVQARFVEKVSGFQTAKAAMKVKDFDAAEEMVAMAMTPVQQATIIKAANNPANVIYAIGRHPQKLAALQAIDDPIELAAAVARLEGTINVTTKRRAAAEPDESVKGSAQISKGEDKVLARLEAEAARTRDRSKVVAYKREQREKAAKR
jgi:hypothetical protein